MPKKRECDRCGFDYYLSELTFKKGFYFCDECLDEDIDRPDARVYTRDKNFNPFIGVTANKKGYGANYGHNYGEGL